MARVALLLASSAERRQFFTGTVVTGPSIQRIGGSSSRCHIDRVPNDSGVRSLSITPFSRLHLRQHLAFNVIRVRDHLATDNLLLGSSHVTKLANAQALRIAHRWPKNSAGHRARLIQVAGLSFWIENRAGALILKILKSTLSVLILSQSASVRVSRKVCPGFRDIRRRALLYTARPLRVF